MEELARAAYGAYCEALGGLGGCLLDFDNLCKRDRAAWIAAVEAVRAVDFPVDNQSIRR